MQMVLPDYATRFDSLSLSACFLDLKGVGDMPRQATGFFWRRAEKIFLVTNWHVVTGLNMMDGKAIGNHWVPERIGLRYFAKDAPQREGWRNMAVPEINVPLFEDFHKPFWLQHSMAYEWNVDVVALDLTGKLAEGGVLCVNDYTYPRLYHFAGSNIFVLGRKRDYSAMEYEASVPDRQPNLKRDVRFSGFCADFWACSIRRRVNSYRQRLSLRIYGRLFWTAVRR
jgi:hypothetical protein